MLTRRQFIECWPTYAWTNTASSYCRVTLQKRWWMKHFDRLPWLYRGVASHAVIYNSLGSWLSVRRRVVSFKTTNPSVKQTPEQTLCLHNWRQNFDRNRPNNTASDVPCRECFMTSWPSAIVLWRLLGRPPLKAQPLRLIYIQRKCPLAKGCSTNTEWRASWKISPLKYSWSYQEQMSDMQQHNVTAEVNYHALLVHLHSMGRYYYVIHAIRGISHMWKKTMFYKILSLQD